MVGVTATGYETIPLSEILVSINSQMRASMGSGFDTSLDTPQGQMIAVFADGISLLHENLQLTYASFDFRQAAGSRLDQLGLLRATPRRNGETDERYRARLLAPRSPTADAVERMVSAVSAVPDVTSVTAQYNASGLRSDSGLQPLTLVLVAEGGDDTAVGLAIQENLVFGLGLVGNTKTCLDGDRTIKFVRPESLVLDIRVVTDTRLSQSMCGGASEESVKKLLTEAFDRTYDGVGYTVSADFLKAVLIAQGIAVQSLTIEQGSPDYAAPQYLKPSITNDSIEVTIGSSAA